MAEVQAVWHRWPPADQAFFRDRLLSRRLHARQRPTRAAPRHPHHWRPLPPGRGSGGDGVFSPARAQRLPLCCQGRPSPPAATTAPAGCGGGAPRGMEARVRNCSSNLHLKLRCEPQSSGAILEPPALRGANRGAGARHAALCSALSPPLVHRPAAARRHEPAYPMCPRPRPALAIGAHVPAAHASSQPSSAAAGPVSS